MTPHMSIHDPPCGEQTEIAISWTSDSTTAPSQSGTDASRSWDSTAGYLDYDSFMPLGQELSNQLIGPLGVLDSSWVLPPWCEKMKDQLPENIQKVEFAWNSGDGSHPDTFVPLCYTGSFGKVQFFWPKVDNTVGLLPSMVVAVKYQDVPLIDQSSIDREEELLRECAGEHVVPLYRMTRQGTESWMTMPFVGYNLRTVIVQGMSDCEAASVFLKLVKGVKNMHLLGILHRDLKPENILVARGVDDLHVLIADLGHACGGKGRWPSDNFATTLEYSAPEIWEHGLVPAAQRDGVRQKESCSLADTYGESTDIWAATIILLQLVLRTVSIPGVLEGGQVISPFSMYLGVLSLANRIEDLIEAAGNLPSPVKAILRTGFQIEPGKRLGPDQKGIDHILNLATEWHAMSKLGASQQCQTSIAHVMERFKSTTNDVAVQHTSIIGTPSVFQPPTPARPGHRLWADISDGEDDSFSGPDTCLEQGIAAPMSPGSMV